MSLFPTSAQQQTTKNDGCQYLWKPTLREPRPCSSWGQVAHVLTPDNFRLSPGKKDFTAPQGLRPASRDPCVRSNLLLFGIATIVAVLSLKDAGVPFLFDRVKKR